MIDGAVSIGELHAARGSRHAFSHNHVILTAQCVDYLSVFLAGATPACGWHGIGGFLDDLKQ